MQMNTDSFWRGILVILVVSLLLVGCGSTTKIQGRVYRNDTDEPNVEAHIMLYDAALSLDGLSESQPVMETQTDSAGRYTFGDVKAGSYRVLISLTGKDPTLATCTMVPEPGPGWYFYSLSFDAVGRAEGIQYVTEPGFEVTSGEQLRKDLGWTCK